LKLEEMRRFCTKPLSLEQLASEVQTNPRFTDYVSCKDGMYFLHGRDELIETRRERAAISEKAWRRARRVVQWIQYVPFLRGILVTGSLAVDSARHRDDLDFLVLVAPRRLWFVFLVLGMLQRIFSRRYLCPNYYLSVDHLALQRRSFYVAREAVQARAACGKEWCRRFHEENRWIYDLFPNARDTRPSGPPVLERRGVLRIVSGAAEWSVRGRFGDAIERFLARRLKKRLTVHYGIHRQEVPETVLSNALEEIELRFHALNHEAMIHRALEKRRERLTHEDPAR
jgi:hypothetical protein